MCKSVWFPMGEQHVLHLLLWDVHQSATTLKPQLKWMTLIISPQCNILLGHPGSRHSVGCCRNPTSKPPYRSSTLPMRPAHPGQTICCHAMKTAQNLKLHLGLKRPQIQLWLNLFYLWFHNNMDSVNKVYLIPLFQMILCSNVLDLNDLLVFIHLNQVCWSIAASKTHRVAVTRTRTEKHLIRDTFLKPLHIPATSKHSSLLFNMVKVLSSKTQVM